MKQLTAKDVRLAQRKHTDDKGNVDMEMVRNELRAKLAGMKRMAYERKPNYEMKPYIDEEQRQSVARICRINANHEVYTCECSCVCQLLGQQDKCPFFLRYCECYCMGTCICGLEPCVCPPCSCDCKGEGKEFLFKLHREVTPRDIRLCKNDDFLWVEYFLRLSTEEWDAQTYSAHNTFVLMAYLGQYRPLLPKQISPS